MSVCVCTCGERERECTCKSIGMHSIHMCFCYQKYQLHVLCA